MKDSMCMCFTGRISRLVNSLNGFSDLVIIKIADNEQIANVISVVRKELGDDYSIENHREIVEMRLTELGYGKDVIDEWVGYID